MEPLHRASKLGKDGRKGQPILYWGPLPNSTLSLPPHPPWMGVGGWGDLEVSNVMLSLEMGCEQ